jgi:uncharacterized protein YggE
MKKTVLLIFALATSMWAVQAQSNTPQHTIEVEGNSEIMIVPDEGIVHITVQKKAMTVAEATKALNADTKKIIDGFKKSGLDHELTANNYYVNVNRIYEKGSSRDSGYVASQNLKVIIKDIEKELPKAVELVNTSGDHSVNVNFSISKEMEKSYKNQLLELALKDAQEKALKIAEVMDLKQVKTQKVQYVSSQVIPRTYMMKANAMAFDSMESREAPSFVPEEQTISDRILVTFVFEP